MMITPEIKIIAPVTLAGINRPMSYLQNETQKLWQTFIPLSKQIQHKSNSDFYSLQIFPDNFFEAFDPTRSFEKWALVPVASTIELPEPCTSFILEGGLYAIFHHKGNDPSIFQNIYSTWIPNSSYKIDNRPHFEILGEKYKNGHPESEEDIYIPIVPRHN